MGYSRKDPNNGGGWEHGISRGTEERTSENSWDQLKKKWNFQECTRKDHVIGGWGGGGWKVYPQSPCLDFSWNIPTLSILFTILTIDDMQDDASDMLRIFLKY